jgi:hypothetical protein
MADNALYLGDQDRVTIFLNAIELAAGRTVYGFRVGFGKTRRIIIRGRHGKNREHTLKAANAFLASFCRAALAAGATPVISGTTATPAFVSQRGGYRRFYASQPDFPRRAAVYPVVTAIPATTASSIPMSA